MFEDMDFTFLNGFKLLSIGPCKYRKEVEKDAVNTTNKAISGFLEQKKSSTAEVDLSLLFVDFKDFDRSRTITCATDFPNRIVVSLKKYAKNDYAYRPVGALKKKNSIPTATSLPYE